MFAISSLLNFIKKKFQVMKKGRSPNRVLRQTNTDHLDELISWARWLDSKVDVAHPTKEMAKKTCKLFSPNAWGEIPGAFRPPKQPLCPPGRNIYNINLPCNGHHTYRKCVRQVMLKIAHSPPPTINSTA